MEREDKSKKVVKEKRSVKKTKALTEPGEAIPEVAAKPKRSSSKKLAASEPASPVEQVIEPPTVEQIQLRAYFIAETRARFGIPGDSTSDWVQAERELTRVK